MGARGKIEEGSEGGRERGRASVALQLQAHKLAAK